MRRNRIVFPKRKKIMPRRFQRTDTHTWFRSDEQFDTLYSPATTALSKKHWTPLHIAGEASRFLATHKGVRILDVGSGVGKFCLSAAHYEPQALFYGVEQRVRLHHQAENAKEALGLENAIFIHGNFTQLDFDRFDHFYFYNSFYENLNGVEKIDDSLDYSSEIFDYYNRYLRTMLQQRPSGTRLVTYHSMEDEIPEAYYRVSCGNTTALNFWIKR